MRTTPNRIYLIVTPKNALALEILDCKLAFLLKLLTKKYYIEYHVKNYGPDRKYGNLSLVHFSHNDVSCCCCFLI